MHQFGSCIPSIMTWLLRLWLALAASDVAFGYEAVDLSTSEFHSFQLGYGGSQAEVQMFLNLVRFL